MVLGQVRRPQLAARLFVGNGEKDEVAGWRRDLSLEEFAKHRRHGCRLVEHIDGTPAPDDSIRADSLEWIHRPTRSSDRHDIGVAQQHERWSARLSSLDSIQHALAAGVRFETEVCDPQVALDRRHRAMLMARIGGSVIDAPVADQGHEQVGDLGGGNGGHRGPLARLASSRCITMLRAEKPFDSKKFLVSR